MPRLLSAAKLSNFTIGLTDVSPSNRTPAALDDTDYMLCAHYPGTVPAGQTVDIECSTLNPRGRYMFLVRRGLDITLALCELEVYAWAAGKFRWHILTTCSSTFQADRGTSCCARWRYTYRVLVAVVMSNHASCLGCMPGRCERFLLVNIFSLSASSISSQSRCRATKYLFAFRFPTFLSALLQIFAFSFSVHCTVQNAIPNACFTPFCIRYSWVTTNSMSGDLAVMRCCFSPPRQMAGNDGKNTWRVCDRRNRNWKRKMLESKHK